MVALFRAGGSENSFRSYDVLGSPLRWSPGSSGRMLSGAQAQARPYQGTLSWGIWRRRRNRKISTTPPPPSLDPPLTDQRWRKAEGPFVDAAVLGGHCLATKAIATGAGRRRVCVYFGCIHERLIVVEPRALAAGKQLAEFSQQIHMHVDFSNSSMSAFFP
jgi:hypothetical protein